MSKDVSFPPNNGAVLNIAHIMKTVMSSAAEAEIGAMYVNARKAVPVRKIMDEMGHRQPRTPMQADNLAAHSVVTNNVQPKRTNAMDMRFYWLMCRNTQGQFQYYWTQGSQNWADYWTKHFPAYHHINMRPEFLTPAPHLENIKRPKIRAVRAVKLAQVIADSSPATRLC